MQPELAPETLLLQRLLTIRPRRMMNHFLKTGVDPVPPVAGGRRMESATVSKAFSTMKPRELAAAMVGYRYLYDDFRDESVGSFISSRCTEPG